MTGFRVLIAKLAEGHRLTRAEAREAFDLMMRGAVGEIEMAAFLMALRLRGETVDEIIGGVEALRGHGSRIPAPAGTVDTCGTGGDGLHTRNISTAVAIVVAAAGVPVAKHGNRAVSSACGSADVLEALGVPLEQTEEEAAATLAALNICFLLAPRHHRAMRHVAPVRKALGIRTIFNILGPMANPAGARRQLIGVYDPRWMRPMAETLRALGAEHVWLVHGSDGMDELTVSGSSQVVALEPDGAIREMTVAPDDVGLARHPLAALRGGGAAENAAALRALLEGEQGAYRDIVLLNAAAALVVADKVADLHAGVALAAETIDTGRAAELLARWQGVRSGAREAQA